MRRHGLVTKAAAPAAPAYVDRGDAWCVVGAGPHGMSALKALLQNGIEADGYAPAPEMDGILGMQAPWGAPTPVEEPPPVPTEQPEQPD